ncbi:MAG: hypothetical protein ACTHMS_17835 [Jatrophihabitans sp.]|uniref:hypothetical protein n=1 Tax=Jatrophihabitans sp. TaxID=1932789 RepID=UPI003F81DFC9
MRIAAGAAAALALSVGAVATATPALACTRSSTYCAAHYYGLLLNTSGKVRAEIDTTTSANNLNKKVFNDAYGDREWVQAPLRDRNAGDGDAVYVHWSWYANGSYCYISSIGVSAGPDSGGVTIGQGCTSGWHSTNSADSKHIQDSNWWFMTDSKGVDPTASSLRVTEKPCQDESWVPDECGGSRLLGISYS